MIDAEIAHRQKHLALMEEHIAAEQLRQAQTTLVSSARPEDSGSQNRVAYVSLTSASVASTASSQWPRQIPMPSVVTHAVAGASASRFSVATPPQVTHPTRCQSQPPGMSLLRTASPQTVVLTASGVHPRAMSQAITSAGALGLTASSPAWGGRQDRSKSPTWVVSTPRGPPWQQGASVLGPAMPVAVTPRGWPTRTVSLALAQPEPRVHSPTRVTVQGQCQLAFHPAARHGNRFAAVSMPSAQPTRQVSQSRPVASPAPMIPGPSLHQAGGRFVLVSNLEANRGHRSHTPRRPTARPVG